MSLEELWQLFPIILEEYNPDYPICYIEEEKNLTTLLAAFDIRRITHIGSTAVVGIISKPIVDILLELPEAYNANDVVNKLEDNGWLLMSRNDCERTLDFNKGYTPDGFADKVFHLHIKVSGDWDELYFRDYLRKHLDVADKYAELKQSLFKKFEHNRDAYTDAKTDFVNSHTKLARTEFPNRHLPAKEKVYYFLNKMNIEYKPVNHPAIYSQADHNEHPVDIGGVILKNLFLRNKKKSNYYLYVLPLEKKADLQSLQKQLNESKLSFGNEDVLMEKLNIKSGSVSLLNIIGVDSTDVIFLIDNEVFQYDKIALHPNDNTASVVFSPGDIIKILDEYNTSYRIIKNN